MEKSVLDTEISCIENIFKQDRPSKVNLLTWLNSTKYEEEVNRIRKVKDSNLKKELKKELTAITPSGLYSKKLTQEYLIRHSGLICIDIDGKDNLHILNFNEIKNMLKEVPQVAYCSLSVSGEGFYVLIPIDNPCKHEVLYRALIEAFKAQGIIVDTKCININRLRFYSHDPDAYYNHNAVPYSFEEKGTILKSRHTQLINKQGTQNNNEVPHNIISQIISNKIDITSNHGDWIKVAYALASIGENGRQYFHDVSAFYPDYNAQECDKTFSSCLKNKKGTVSVGSLIHICKKYGITGY